MQGCFENNPVHGRLGMRDWGARVHMPWVLAHAMGRHTLNTGGPRCATKPHTTLTHTTQLVLRRKRASTNKRTNRSPMPRRAIPQCSRVHSIIVCFGTKQPLDCSAHVVHCRTKGPGCEGLEGACELHCRGGGGRQVCKDTGQAGGFARPSTDARHPNPARVPNHCAWRPMLACGPQSLCAAPNPCARPRMRVRGPRYLRATPNPCVRPPIPAHGPQSLRTAPNPCARRPIPAREPGCVCAAPDPCARPPIPAHGPQSLRAAPEPCALPDPCTRPRNHAHGPRSLPGPPIIAHGPQSLRASPKPCPRPPIPARGPQPQPLLSRIPPPPQRLRTLQKLPTKPLEMICLSHSRWRHSGPFKVMSPAVTHMRGIVALGCNPSSNIRRHGTAVRWWVGEEGGAE